MILSLEGEIDGVQV